MQEDISPALFIWLGRPILIASMLTLLGCSAARANAVEEVGALNRRFVELYGRGKYAEALSAAESALSLAEKTLGAEHQNTLTSVNNVGALYERQGRYSEAETLLKRALAGREKTLGPEHPDTLNSVSNLAALYQEQRRSGEAEPLLKRALAAREKTLGPEHPDTLTSVNNLAMLYERQGRDRESEPLLKRALAAREKALGPEHPDTLNSVNNLGSLYEAEGRHDEAEPLLRRAAAGREKALGATATEAAEIVWGVVNVEGSEGQRLSYYATNGKSGPVVLNDKVLMKRGGNFGIGCFKGSRYIFLNTGPLDKDIGNIKENGFVDIELYNGEPKITLSGRLVYNKESNAVDFSPADIDQNKFALIAARLMSGTDKLGFRIREGSRENPGFTFAGEIGVGKKAPVAVVDALRNCGFI